MQRILLKRIPAAVFGIILLAGLCAPAFAAIPQNADELQSMADADGNRSAALDAQNVTSIEVYGYVVPAPAEDPPPEKPDDTTPPDTGGGGGITPPDPGDENEEDEVPTGTEEEDEEDDTNAGTTEPARPGPPGGFDPDRPPTPSIPGHSVILGENGSYIELDENGIPLGEWRWDENAGQWIFDPEVPMGALSLAPKTGDAGIGADALCALFSLLLFAVLLRARARSGDKTPSPLPELQ
jgi:hypothetical protein